MSQDKPVPPVGAEKDDLNPPTARTRAIREDIVADTRRVKSSNIALGAALAAVVACAVGVVLLLILRP